MFAPAQRTKARLRLALIGPAGSGKTFTGLRIAAGLLPPGGRLAVIDTEHGSANLYAGEANPDGGVFAFDAVRLDEWPGKFKVENYIKALEGAAAAGYPVVLVDSLSHAWAGPGGLLEVVDSKSDKFGSGWREATPKHHKFIDALLSYPGDIVATVRSKMEHVVEEVNGKKVVRKVGLQPVQRDGLDYEFTAVGDLDQGTHRLHITKSRCSAISDATYDLAGADLARTLRAWLDLGTTAAAPAPAPKPAEPPAKWSDAAQRAFFAELAKAAPPPGVKYDDLARWCEAHNRPRPSVMAEDQRKKLLLWLRDDGNQFTVVEWAAKNPAEEAA